MSEQLFEVAFSGQISDGADADEVRARLAKMFSADEAKLAQLFSGRRVIVKKNIDQATAAKYKTALNRAGAECEVAAMGGETAPAKPASEAPAASAAAPASAPSMEYEANDYGEVAPPPQTDPLGITGDDIEDLAVTIAPVGSELKDDYQDPEEPDIDVTGLEVAPVGADLDTAPKKPDPPPPDTTGITLAD
jgi:hypothetical protein